MIRLICGPKGTGKTKIILESVEDSVKVAKGNVVFITDKKIDSAKIDFSVRCIYANEYGISGSDALRGFVNGLIAGNSDIEYLFLDGVTRIIGTDKNNVENFFSDIVRLEKEYGFKVIMSVSLSANELPEDMKKFAE